MSSRKVLALQARRRRAKHPAPPGKKEKHPATHHKKWWRKTTCQEDVDPRANPVLKKLHEQKDGMEEAVIQLLQKVQEEAEAIAEGGLHTGWWSAS